MVAVVGMEGVVAADMVAVAATWAVAAADIWVVVATSVVEASVAEATLLVASAEVLTSVEATH